MINILFEHYPDTSFESLVGILCTKKESTVLVDSLCSAERQGFEPRVPRSTTVFKTAAIDHSAISPDAGANIEVSVYFENYFSLFFSRTYFKIR